MFPLQREGMRPYWVSNPYRAYRPREAYSCDINPPQGGSESELQTGAIYHGEDLGLFIFGDLRLIDIGFKGTYPLWGPFTRNMNTSNVAFQPRLFHAYQL